MSTLISPSWRWRIHFLCGAALICLLIGQTPQVKAQGTMSCDKPIARGSISAEVAKKAGLKPGANGYVLDSKSLAERAGGPIPLLEASRGQLGSNMNWFAAMAPIVADPDTPRLLEVQALYQQALEMHEIELGVQHAMECMLGLQPSAPQRPETLASLRQARETRIAQEREQQALQASRDQAASNLADFLGTLGKALGAAGAATTGAASGSAVCTECAEGRGR